MNHEFRLLSLTGSEREILGEVYFVSQATYDGKESRHLGEKR